MSSRRKREWEREKVSWDPNPWDWDDLNFQERLLREKLNVLELTSRYDAKDFLWLRRNWPGGIGTRLTLGGISVEQYATAFGRLGIPIEIETVYPYVAFTQWADIWHERKPLWLDRACLHLLCKRTYEQQEKLAKVLKHQQASVEQVLEYLLDMLLQDRMEGGIHEIPFADLTFMIDPWSDTPSGDFGQCKIRCYNSVYTPSESPYVHELLLVVERDRLKLDVEVHPLCFNDERTGVTMLMLKEVANTEDIMMAEVRAKQKGDACHV